MTDEEIRDLLSKATPGPWSTDGLYVVWPKVSEGWLIADCGTANSPDAAPGNVALIAAAPDLAAEVLRQRTDLSEARAEIAALRGLPEGAVGSGWECERDYRYDRLWARHDAGTRAVVWLGSDGSVLWAVNDEADAGVAHPAPTLRGAMRAALEALGVTP
jgi:hypothetical protein